MPLPPSLRKGKLLPATVVMRSPASAWMPAAFLAMSAALFAAAPEITVPPQPGEIAYRDSAVMNVQTAGEEVTLQWYAGVSGDISAPVPGATGPMLVSQPLGSAASFWVRATNPDGHADSPAAAVTVRPPLPGVVKGMGNNVRGQLYGALGSTLVPQTILGGVTAIAAGDRHSLMIKEDRSLWGIGDNNFHQLGPGTDLGGNPPRQMASDVIQVNAGGFHTLYIRGDGSLWAVGFNNFGQLGDGTTTVRAQPFQMATGVADAAGGEYHTAFVKTDGSLWATGYNPSGALGDGTLTNRLIPVQTASGVARVYSFYHHTLFLKTDGSLWGMGYNERGQLGDGSVMNRSLPVKIADGVVSAACGYSHSLFRTTDNTMWGMGSNLFGQLGVSGTGFDDNRLTPVILAHDVVGVASGSFHSLFITADHVLHTTGSNQTYGPLGDGTTDQRHDPYPAGLAVAAAAGDSFSLFLDASPRIADAPDSVVIATGTATTLSVVAEGPPDYSYQWYQGQPGDVGSPLEGATASTYITPVLIQDATYWVRISNPYGHVDSPGVEVSIATQPIVESMSGGASVAHAGNASVSAAVAGGYMSYQWYSGSSGDTSAPVAGATSDMLLTPPLVADSIFWVRATNAAGAVDSPAVRVEVGPVFKGILSTCGINSAGQLGIGTKVNSTARRQISIAVAAVAGGVEQNFFIKSDHSLWAMGENSSGELGDGSLVDRTLPVKVADGVAAVYPASRKTYFIKTDGSLWATGLSPLGHPGETLQSPVKVGEGFASLDSGTSFILALKTDGSLWGEGANDSGQLGQGNLQNSTGVFVRIAGDVVKAVAGNRHSLFVKRDGSLWGMGNGSYGKLGMPVTNSQKSPVQILASGVAEVSAGWDYSLFLKDDGSLWGMGTNSDGQLGTGSTQSSVPQPLQIASGVIDMSAGDYHALFLKSNRELWGMGSNSSGEFGDGSTTNRYSPVLVATSVVEFCGGRNQSMILEGRPAITTQPLASVIVNGQQAQASAAADSGVPVNWQWYRGASGDTSSPVDGATESSYQSPALFESVSLWARATNEYGHSDTASVLVEVTYPPAITGISPAQTVEHTESAVFSVSATGGALSYLWYAGEPGDTSVPVAVNRRPDFVTRPLRAPGRYWVRVSNLAGTVDSAAVNVMVRPAQPTYMKVTGRNSRGQVGDGTTVVKSSPVEIAARVLRVAAGASHTLFLKDDGTLWGMGYNQVGQLGASAQINQKVPIQIASGVIDMAAGDSHTLFIKADGSLWAMGGNGSGQLGAGSTGNRSVPVQISSGVVQVSGGRNHSAFLKGDGTCWAMGSNASGQIGIGLPLPPDNYTTPVKIADNVAYVTAGGVYTMLVKSDGSLWGAGSNTKGQLGDGTTTMRLSPVEVLTGVQKVACGFDHTLIRKIDGTLWAMGSNGAGQLGIGPVPDKWSPVLVAPDVVSIEAGISFSMFTTGSGDLRGMGNNVEGQLGNGVAANHTLPVPLGKASAMACGDAHSVILDGRPMITGQPGSLALEAGQVAALQVTAVGPGTLAYQWYRGIAGDTSNPIAGVDAPFLLTEPLVESGFFWVKVSSSYGSEASATAVITVTGGGTPAYRQWAAAHGLDATQLRTTLDPDGDGWSNLFEYGLGGDPLAVGDQRPVASMETDESGAWLVLRHRHRIGAAVNFTYEWSGDLAHWQVFTPQVSSEPVDEEIEIIRVARPLAGDEGMGFIRVSVSEP